VDAVDVVELAGDRALVAEFAFDTRTSTWTWSQGLRDLHGLAKTEQPRTDHMLQAAHPEDIPVLEAGLRRLLAQPGPDTWTYRMTDAAGRLRRLRVVATALGSGEDVTTLEGFVLDVTQDIRDWQAEAVDAALEHRATIEQAKGALMVALRIDDEEAFDVLRSVSSHRNEKLWAVAQHLVCELRAHGDLDWETLRLLHWPLTAGPQHATPSGRAAEPVAAQSGLR
jgi:hypothetical protein